MQKTLALLLSGSLLIVGCGKKHEGPSKKSKNKHVASLTQDGDVPLLLSENQSLLDADADNEFAFVDTDEMYEEGKVGAVAVGDKKKKGYTIDLDKEDAADQELVANLDLDSEEFNRVQFDFNQNNIRKDQTATVKKDITLAKKAIAAGKEVVVAGHTCQLGSAAYNIALSQKRAEAVKKEMMRDGLPAEKVKTLGLGFEAPLVTSDATSRAEQIRDLAPNRRAEVNVA